MTRKLASNARARDPEPNRLAAVCGDRRADHARHSVPRAVSVSAAARWKGEWNRVLERAGGKSCVLQAEDNQCLVISAAPCSKGQRTHHEVVVVPGAACEVERDDDRPVALMRWCIEVDAKGLPIAESALSIGGTGRRNRDWAGSVQGLSWAQTASNALP